MCRLIEVKMTIFRYPLTDQQYARFVNDPNTTGEIDNLARVLGVNVIELPPNSTGIAMRWVFTGKCEGDAYLVNIGPLHTCVVEVRKKPWWLFDFVLDYGFRKVLK
jgi:hypothetical protein